MTFQASSRAQYTAPAGSRGSLTGFPSRGSLHGCAHGSSTGRPGFHPHRVPSSQGSILTGFDPHRVRSPQGSVPAEFLHRVPSTGRPRGLPSTTFAAQGGDPRGLLSSLNRVLARASASSAAELADEARPRQEHRLFENVLEPAFPGAALPSRCAFDSPEIPNPIPHCVPNAVFPARGSELCSSELCGARTLWCANPHEPRDGKLVREPCRGNPVILLDIRPTNY
jgi:hypothetical protein